MRWNKIGMIGLISMIAVVITACTNANNSGDSILPFTSIVPGMSMEEIRKLEPEMEEEDGWCYLTKDYQGFPMEGEFDQESIDTIIIWTCYDDELDLDQLVDSLTTYFDKRYEVYTTMEEDSFSATDWRTDKYDILLKDSVFRFMGTESREITLSLSVRLDLKAHT